MTKMKQLMDRFETTDMGPVSKVLDMKVIRDREKGTITIDQKERYTEDVLEYYRIWVRKLVCKHSARLELSLS